eukprot:403344179
MSDILKCGKCNKIFNTGKRLPIELPCSAKICNFRNACKKCVEKHILTSKAEDGSYKCCYNDQHTIGSDFTLEIDVQTQTQILKRKELTIKCMKHADQYVEHYCTACKELICIRCYPAHMQHINDQGVDSGFSPEIFTNYLMFVIPELEQISAQINLTLKIFKKALSSEKEYFADEVTDRITKSFDLLKKIIPEKDIYKFYLHQPNQNTMTTSEPQGETTYGCEEECKATINSDQIDQNSLMERIRSLELKRLK